MEGFIQILGWPIFIAFVFIHIALLLFNKREAVLYTSSIMTGYGLLSMIIGLIYFLRLGVYGVIVMLVGCVFHISTKDYMEKG